MIRNYCLIAWRNLRRNTIYSIINVAGLSVGIASSILIMLWVGDELSYDRFHERYDRLHQVYVNQVFSGEIRTSPNSPYPLLDALPNQSAAIAKVSAINHGEGYLIGVGENKLTKMGTAASAHFLEMFSFKVIKGNATKALSDPSSIVLTESLAKALFGDGDPLNKGVMLEARQELKVAAVIADVPAQSTLQFDFLLPFTQEWVRESRTNWNSNSFRIFVELQPEADIRAVNNSIADLIRNNNNEAPTAGVFLHPMAKWRLYSEFENGTVAGGLIEYVTMFAAVGIFILVIACINFMNLATARSESRAREVGIRKSVGSMRKQIVVQFLGESFFITVIAFAFAIVIVEITLPFYGMLVNKKLAIAYGDPGLWLGAIALIALTGFLSGSYPAFYLSSFQAAKVLKGKTHVGKGSVTPRKLLVTLQFGLSVFLVIGTIAIYLQVIHVKARHTGYNKENLLLIWTTREIEKNFSSLNEELKKSGVVKSVCKSSAPVTRIFSTTSNIMWPGRTGNEKTSFVTVATEYDYTETMGIRMLEGRDFSRDFPSDSSAVVINQSALELMGLQNPVGQTIEVFGSRRTIVGVMEDVVMGSPFDPVDPTLLVFIPGWSSTISIRMEATPDLAGAIATLERTFKKFDPEHPLWYRFADTEFQGKFSAINLISTLALIFALLAIVISCLGLFGLAAFSAEQRTKELGIRKVMGASVASLVMLISKDFSRLVTVAFVISAPVAWWAVNSFLERYPYHVDIPWWIFLVTGAGALLLALAVVSTQAFRAATTDPVKSLRSE